MRSAIRALDKLGSFYMITPCKDLADTFTTRAAPLGRASLGVTRQSLHPARVDFYRCKDMKRRCYSKSEIKFLITAYKAAGSGKVNAMEIATTLNRTYSSVLHKAQRLGVALTGRQQQTWERHPGWRGDLVSKNQARDRARQWYERGACEKCSKPGYDRHHVDGNPYNNIPSNVQVLCRRCHMIADGRLERFKAFPKPLPKPPTPCCVCRRLYKPLRKGRCPRCDAYFRSHGSERSFGLPYVTMGRL